MATPTLEQTRAAGLSLSAMPQSKFDERRHAEAGDALVAFFVILAKKLFPKATEQELRVRLTVRLYGREVASRLFGSVPADAR